MTDSAFLLGIVAQTLGMGLIVARASKWAGSVDSAFTALTKAMDTGFAVLTKALDDFKAETSSRFDGVEERLQYLERRRDEQ